MKIIATSDIHGYNLEKLKSLPKDAILIDNGDFFIGSSFATYEHHENNSQSFIEYASLFDVIVPGNHDFDYGLEFYLSLLSKVDVPVVSCNIFDHNKELLFEPYIIIEKDDMKVAVIGAMTSNLFQLSRYENVKDISVKNAPSEIKKWVEKLQGTVDKIVVSYHGGIERDLLTGKETQYQTKEDQAYEISTIAGIDLLICGHQHRENVGVVQDTLIVQIPDRLKKVALIDLNLMHHSWLIIEDDVVENKDFNAWLETSIDHSKLDAFVSSYFSSDLIYLQIEGKRIKDLISAFAQVYPIREYQFSFEEISEFKWFEGDRKPSYTVCSNVDLGYERLKRITVHNIFDAYYHFLFGKKNN